MNRLHLVTSALALALSACGSGDQVSSSRPSSGSSEQGSASAALAALQDDLVERDSGRFSSSSFIDEVAVTVETGEYQLSARRFAIERELQAPDGKSYGMEVRVVDDVAYLQMRDWPAPMRGCWFTYDDAAFGKLAEGMAVEGVPVPVSLLGQRLNLPGKVPVPAHSG